MNLRPVYRYSVIAGGAYSPAEVAFAERSDPVVREHYSMFRNSRLRILRNPAARRAYVSYRIGDAIYWTRNPVALPAGEMLISDGEHEARARCGNRIAATPQKPFRAPEPALPEFDTAEPVPPEVELSAPRLTMDLFPALIRGPEPAPIPANQKPMPAGVASPSGFIWYSAGIAGLPPFSLGPPATISPITIAGSPVVEPVLAPPLLPNPWYPIQPPALNSQPVWSFPEPEPLPVAAPVLGIIEWPTFTLPSAQPALPNETNAVPEPGTALLIGGLGLALFAAIRLSSR